MGYLITHIAISLVFAQLLGLLLGWLLWGYSARQRGREVLTLRQRMADMQILFSREMSPAEPRIPLPDASVAFLGGTESEMPIRPSHAKSSRLIENDLEVESKSPGRRSAQSLFFESELPEQSASRGFFGSEGFGSQGFGNDDEQVEIKSSPQPLPAVEQPPTPRAAATAASEIDSRDSRHQQLQDQVRELEGVRDRLPLLQADLSNAIAGRKTAEAKYQEARNEFEVRSRGLLSQIRDYEAAAAEWDRTRDRLDQQRMDLERELSAVRSTLRDVQNSQRPQTVEAAAAAPVVLAPPLALPVAQAKDTTAAELEDLRDRYQAVIREREAIAVELEVWKQSAALKADGNGRLHELEETLRSKDQQLAEQAARVESLLWRVAELEPFVTEAPQKDESLRRQEAEIAGHIALHADDAERIRRFENQIHELESTTIPASELQQVVASHQAELTQLASEHKQRLAEWRQSLALRDGEIAEHVSARHNQAAVLDGLHARVAAHQLELNQLSSQHDQRVSEWRQALASKDQEIAGHVAALQGQANLLSSLQARVAELETATENLNALEKIVHSRDAEIRGILAAHSETQQELETWKAQANELEPIAARVPELQGLLDTHAGELQRLKQLQADKEARLADQQGQLTFLQERLNVASSLLSAHQQRIQHLEPLAARSPELEAALQTAKAESLEQIKSLDQRHHSELTRLKVASAQRVRRLRQSITAFKI